MTSIHLRRLESRLTRTVDRAIAHATREQLGVVDLRDMQLPWYRIRQSPGVAADDDTATILIYDEIGGSVGVTAKRFAEELEQITAAVIRVRINSPGGSAWDAIAIHNSLLHHPAKIVVYVDALAASAASIIAMAGDEIVMMPGGQMMIHDASVPFDGDAREHEQIAVYLHRQSANVASIYAARAGGDPAEWRTLMLAETWAYGAEAVDLRLADRIEERQLAVAAEPEPDPDPEVEELMGRAFDLSMHRYAGREHAPAPPKRQPGRPVTAGRRSNNRTPEPDPEPESDAHFTRAYTDTAGRNLADDPAGSPIPFTAATPGVKRDGLDLRAAGWYTANYDRNPVVLWAHSHTAPSIGRADASVRSDRLHTLVTFDQEDPFAARIESKYRRGFLSAVSVGWDFVDAQGTPVNWRRLSAADMRDRAFYDLTELSAVPVPSDPDALVARQRAALRHISRELTDLFDDMQDPDGELTAPQAQQAVVDECVRLGIPLDLAHWQPVDPAATAIPPHTTPIDDDRDATWDAGAQVGQVEGRAQLRRMHAWVDGDADAEAKGSYKLPHHRADGTLVWRGLTAAMGRLNQSGTDIDDRPGTWTHLARHYRQFGEEPPPLADISEPPASAGVDQKAARTVLAAFNLEGNES